MRAQLPCVLLLVISLSIAGCGKKSPPKEQTSAELETQVVPDMKLSEDESLAIAADMEIAVNNHDLDRLNNQLYNWGLCIDLSMTGVGFGKDDRDDVKRGLLSTVKLKQGLFFELAAVINRGGRYVHLRTREVDGKTRMLFRLTMPEGGVSYHDFFLMKNESGVVQAYDVYIYLAGERLTETVRRMLLQIMASQNRGVVARLGGREQLLVNNLDKVQQMGQMLRNGNPEGALATYDSLPQELQREKFMLILAFRGAQDSNNDPRYEQIMGNFREWFPNDPAANFMSIDYFTLQKDYDKAMQAINILEKSLGGDPYTGVLRAGLFVLTKKFDEAKRVLENSIAAEPSLQEAYWSLVTVSLEEQQFADTVKWLITIDEKFGVEPLAIATEPSFADFRNSPQHREWLAYVNSR